MQYIYNQLGALLVSQFVLIGVVNCFCCLNHSGKQVKQLLRLCLYANLHIVVLDTCQLRRGLNWKRGSIIKVSSSDTERKREAILFGREVRNSEGHSELEEQIKLLKKRYTPTLNMLKRIISSFFRFSHHGLEVCFHCTEDCPICKLNIKIRAHIATYMHIAIITDHEKSQRRNASVHSFSLHCQNRYFHAPAWQWFWIKPSVTLAMQCKYWYSSNGIFVHAVLFPNPNTIPWPKPTLIDPNPRPLLH